MDIFLAVLQVQSPEDVFLGLLLSCKSHERAEEFGITYRLDVCGLYQEAANRELRKHRYAQALKLFELSRVRETHTRVALVLVD